MASSWSAPASVVAVLLAVASCPVEGFFVPGSQPLGRSLLQHTHEAASSRTRASTARGGQLSCSSIAGAWVRWKRPRLCGLLLPRFLLLYPATSCWLLQLHVLQDQPAA